MRCGRGSRRNEPDVRFTDPGPIRGRRGHTGSVSGMAQTGGFTGPDGEAHGLESRVVSRSTESGDDTRKVVVWLAEEVTGAVGALEETMSFVLPGDRYSAVELDHVRCDG